MLIRKLASAIVLSASLQGCAFGGLMLGMGLSSKPEPCVRDYVGEVDGKAMTFNSNNGMFGDNLIIFSEFGTVKFYDYDRDSNVDGVEFTLNPTLPKDLHPNLIEGLRKIPEYYFINNGKVTQTIPNVVSEKSEEWKSEFADGAQKTYENYAQKLTSNAPNC